jgi:methionyl-tRNA formyltransferase
MRVVKALDAGPMLARVTRPIGPDETSETVERDLALLGADLLVAVLDDLVSGRAVETPQNDAEATYAPRLTKEEGFIDWSRSAADVHNQVRGLRPWPAAYTFLDGARVVVHQSRRSGVETGDAGPGVCVAAATTITVACGDRRGLDLLQLQLEGRRVVGGRDFLAGQGRLVGRQFGGP